MNSICEWCFAWLRNMTPRCGDQMVPVCCNNFAFGHSLRCDMVFMTLDARYVLLRNINLGKSFSETRFVWVGDGCECSDAFVKSALHSAEQSTKI